MDENIGALLAHDESVALLRRYTALLYLADWQWRRARAWGGFEDVSQNVQPSPVHPIHSPSFVEI